MTASILESIGLPCVIPRVLTKCLFQNAARDASDGEEHLDKQPQGNILKLGLTEQLFPKLGTNDTLGSCDGTQDPTLSSNSLASSVRHVDIILPT